MTTRTVKRLGITGVAAVVAGAAALTIVLATSSSSDEPSSTAKGTPATSTRNPTPAPKPANDDTSAAKSATAKFHKISVAKEAGFGELKDAAGIACIDDPAGGMGIHYVNGDRVGDPSETATSPEVLVYEPKKNGKLQLVALEYVVVKADWEKAGNKKPPTLFGHEFHLMSGDNRYGLPPFYELHAWVWKHNPSGMFEDWNPTVTCAHA